ncbi:MAG TPA: tetratricopeptide repeat protein [Pyrinomonadaceae bacterium]|nr:tetratricopeptide repeat protein [Pyrinomonadaceae bacterium]
MKEMLPEPDSLRRALLLLLLAACCCAASPAPRARGQAKPNIAGDVEGKKKAPPAPKPAPENRQGQRRRQTAVAPKPAPPPTAPTPPLEVIFYTGLADADIYVNAGQATMQRLGRSGADARLVARLPRGLHTVTASRPGSRIERRQIEVRPGSTTFVFDLSSPAASPYGSPVSAGPGTTAADVFRRYLDPKKTDAVTAAEWQLAQAETAAAFAANPLDPQAEAQALFARGQLSFLRGDYGAAVNDFNASALRLPSSALAYYGLGNAYLGAGRLGEAGRAFQRAAELSPQLAMAYRGTADVLARQNKNRDALRYYEQARVLGYTSPSTRQVTARILLKERRWAQALKELSEVSKASPSAEVFVGMGDAYVGLGQPLSAAPAYRRAIELDPKSAPAHYKFGELAYNQREYAAAAESLERALALDPAGALIDRGRAREMANKAAAKARAAR